ncbi:MAG: PAS domain-containing protein [Deltaproteobacteria bacterium]|nr:PAS domain-containing protein [Deltaproteobacteria bacterium]
MANKRPLLWHLFPSFALIILVSVVAVTWYASTSLKEFFLQQTASDLKARARLFERQAVIYFSPVDENKIDQLCKRAGEAASTRITVILSSGRVVGDSMEAPRSMDNHMDRPEIVGARTRAVGSSTRHSRTLNRKMMYVAVPVKREGRLVGYIRTAIGVETIDIALREVRLRIAFSALVIAIFGAILSFLAARRIAGPIKEIEKSAQCFARGELDCRVPVSNLTEIGSLSETLNQMAGELQERIHTITAQRNELEAVLSSMVEGVLAVDMDEKIMNMNHAAARFFGCSPDAAVGRTIQEVVRNTDLQRFVGKALSSEVRVEQDIALFSDGERILGAHGTPLRGAGEHREGTLIVLEDVTRLRRLENIRKDFVANVSHEIKTPVTAIKGFVETLGDGAMQNPEDAKRFLGIIDRHVDRLEAIIEDLLSLSRIEQEEEKEEILLANHPIRDVLVSAIQVCQPKAKRKNVAISLSCSEDLSAEINATLLEQAIVNLLDNAIKYSHVDSEIRVSAKQNDQDILIDVRDQGMGIEKQHLSRLFERFYRVDKARSRKLGGTGLGLAIVKHIVQVHRGRVAVDSVPGHGSTFSIHLPSPRQ